jgi:putative copper export protein
MQTVLPIFITFLHDLFTAIWIGGLIVLGAVFLAAIKKQKQQYKELSQKIQKRLNTIVFVSIIGLWITGILLSNRSPSFTGFFDISNTYSLVLALKHAIVIIMTVFALIRTQLVVRTKKITESNQKYGAILLIINIILGISVLLLSAYTAILANSIMP